MHFMRHARLAVLCVLMCLLPGLCGCGGRTRVVEVDYGQSEIYASADMDAAIAVIKQTFSRFDGCVLHRLEYAGDERSLSELDYVKRTYTDADYCQCIVFNSSFRSPLRGGGAWEANEEYTWSWYLAREENGSWKLLTYGYG